MRASCLDVPPLPDALSAELAPEPHPQRSQAEQHQGALQGKVIVPVGVLEATGSP